MRSRKGKASILGESDGIGVIEPPGSSYRLTTFAIHNTQAITVVREFTKALDATK
jgi:hypothetical protein